MQHFVTGATGFIRKRLVKALLARRGAVIHFLVRPGSEIKLADLYAYWGLKGAARSRAVAVTGDLTAPRLGLGARDLKSLHGRIDAVYHLASVYDLAADEDSAAM